MRKLKDDHYNIKNSILRQIQKLKNGKGNGFANPPDNFSPEIMDEKERKSLLSKVVRLKLMIMKCTKIGKMNLSL